MKKNAIFLTIAILLSISTLLIAFTITEEFQVIVFVNQYAVIETPEELNIALFDQDTASNYDSDQFSIRTNFALNLDIESGGFSPALLNTYIRYYIDQEEITPGIPVSSVLSVAQSTYQTATFAVELKEEELIENEEWETVIAGNLSDIVVFTISAQ